MFGVDIYKAHLVQGGVDTPVVVNVMNNFPTLILAVVMTVVPLIAIGMFKNRKQQRGMTAFGIVAIMAFMGVVLGRVANLSNKVPAPTDGAYSIFSVLPILAIIFLFMAISGIKKDEKLIKSLDRLR